jgi:undecaprenyl diphosphate synthase
LVSTPELGPGWPRHVAIIMDGNGRWARKRMLPRLEGHRQGAKAVRRAVEFGRRNGLDALTLYAFSTENWQRPQREVSGLMSLLSQYLDSELEELDSHDIRFTTIGELDRLPEKLAARIETAKGRTSGNRSMTLNVALSYGGREEILRAACRLGRAMKEGRMAEDAVNEKVFSEFLYTSELPDPDLLIRTGGEFRLSNFLLWQTAYTEFFFTPVLWPDFDDDEFLKAVEEYRSRQRRYGMTSEQVESGETNQ